MDSLSGTFSSFFWFGSVMYKYRYGEFSKKLQLNCTRKVKKKNVGEHTFPIRFFQSVYWPPKLFPTHEHAKIKNYFLQNAIFYFLPFFSLCLKSTQSEFGCYKNALNHCTLPTMVSLASFTSIVLIMIPKWGQNTTKFSQDSPVFPFLPLIVVNGFFSTPKLKFGYRWLYLKLGNIFQDKTEVSR